MGRIMYLRQCPDPETVDPREYCDCECRFSHNYMDCFEECMLDFGKPDYYEE
jgi:hypothetical protein